MEEPQGKELREEILSQSGKKILVSYFSYSGTTKNIANEIRKKTGADLFEILSRDGYSNVYTKSNSEIRHNERPVLRDTVKRTWMRTILCL